MNTANETNNQSATTNRTSTAGDKINTLDHPIGPSADETTTLSPAISEELAPKQSIALNALIAGKRIHEAAAAAGVNRRTLTRWLQSPVFRAALNYELQQITQQTAIRSAGVTNHALDALDRLITSADDPAIVIRAARAILQHRPPPIQHGPTDPESIAHQDLLVQLRRTLLTRP
jgi:hypothetical protein